MINAVQGAPARLAALAAGIVRHWEARSEAMRKFISSPGKAFIVGDTREVCANLHIAYAPDPAWLFTIPGVSMRSRIATLAAALLALLVFLSPSRDNAPAAATSAISFTVVWPES